MRTHHCLECLGSVHVASIYVTEFEKEGLERDLLTAIVVISNEIWKN